MTHPACLIFFIICRISYHLTRIEEGFSRHDFSRHFLESSLSSSFSTLASLQFLIIPRIVVLGNAKFPSCKSYPMGNTPFGNFCSLNLVIMTIALSFLLCLWFTYALQLFLNLIFSKLFKSTSLYVCSNSMFNLLEILKKFHDHFAKTATESVLERQ